MAPTAVRGAVVPQHGIGVAHIPASRARQVSAGAAARHAGPSKANGKGYYIKLPGLAMTCTLDPT